MGWRRNCMALWTTKFVLQDSRQSRLRTLANGELVFFLFRHAVNRTDGGRMHVLLQTSK